MSQRAITQQEYLDVSLSTDRASFEQRLVKFAQDMGFERVSAALAIDRPGDRPYFEMVGNTPRAFLEASRNAADAARDPLIRRMKTSPLPFTYDQATYVSEGAGDLWEEQAAFGYRTGVSMALHMPAGRHFLLGVDRTQALPEDNVQCMRMMADLQLLAAFSQETAVRVLGPEPPALACVPRLTAREREVLQWTREGKSSWAVGEILGLSENTVNFHLRNAMKKLDASSKHVAILRAINLGLL
jgi:DNA-binding CsgD family transcriptional regulator